MHFMDRINKNIYRNILRQMDKGKHKKEEETQNLKLKSKSFIQSRTTRSVNKYQFSRQYEFSIMMTAEIIFLESAGHHLAER